jgi:NAD(P)-dependent dehydrogenase (short-subunit alcohol dehydrogenase family)
MKHIVITGSTRGIGYGLAEALLALGCSVTVSGRAQPDVDLAVANLSQNYQDERIFGVNCDVRHPDQIQALWEQAKARFQKIDIWVNNAGYSGPIMAAWEMPAEKVDQVIETNLLGTIYGSMIAVREMLTQGHGAIYIMEGMGSDGRMHEGLTYYGTSKYGLRYFTKSLIKEAEGTPLVIGSLRPGMVATDLLTRQYKDRPDDWERDKRIFNILADKVGTVAPWLAERMLENDKSGAQISWSSSWKLMGRFLISPFHKRDIFE